MEYFILAILLIYVIVPVLEGITSLLLTMIETAKGYFGVQIAKYNNSIHNMPEENSYTHSIGFSYSTNEEEDEEDES